MTLEPWQFNLGIEICVLVVWLLIVYSVNAVLWNKSYGIKVSDIVLVNVLMFAIGILFVVLFVHTKMIPFDVGEGQRWKLLIS